MKEYKGNYWERERCDRERVLKVAQAIYDSDNFNVKENFDEDGKPSNIVGHTLALFREEFGHEYSSDVYAPIERFGHQGIFTTDRIVLFPNRKEAQFYLKMGTRDAVELFSQSPRLTKITKEKAIDVLIWFAKTGMVSWEGTG